MTHKWKEKEPNPKDFLEARNGDHAITPFECDTCIFRKLRKKSPDDKREQDRLLLVMIRRANLDAFWSRARSTVNQNTQRIKLTLKLSELMGLDGPYEHEGPYPYYDHCGYEIAATTLMHSRRPGRHDNTHTQFATIRHGRGTFSSHVRASPLSNTHHFSLVDQKGKYIRISRDKCGSLWYHRFMVGLKIRMGSIWKPNKGLSHKLLMAVIEKTEEKIGEIEDSISGEDKSRWIVFSAYMIVAYVLSLRGNEALMLDLGGIRKCLEVDREDHFVVVLWGKLKGETAYRAHNIPCINVTKSGINVKFTIERLIAVKEDERCVKGPAISDKNGFLLSTGELDQYLHEILMDLYEVDPSYFPPSITSVEDILGYYRCYRTWRRTSVLRAHEEKVGTRDINIVNKWEQAGGPEKGAKNTSQPMMMHYAEFELLKKPFKRYTYEM